MSLLHAHTHTHTHTHIVHFGAETEPGWGISDGNYFLELVWPLAKDEPRKSPSKNFGMVPTWKTKKGKTSKFVDEGGYNKDKRQGNWRLGISRQRRVKKERKFLLGTEKCENTKKRYINKQMRIK